MRPRPAMLSDNNMAVCILSRWKVDPSLLYHEIRLFFLLSSPRVFSVASFFLSFFFSFAWAFFGWFQFKLLKVESERGIIKCSSWWWIEGWESVWKYFIKGTLRRRNVCTFPSVEIADEYAMMYACNDSWGKKVFLLREIGKFTTTEEESL